MSKKAIDITVISTRFVDLVLKHYRWEGFNEISAQENAAELPADKIQVLYDMLSVVSFNRIKIVPGKLTDSFKEDGISKTFVINNFSPFIVIRDSKGLVPATSWLEFCFRSVIFGSKRDKKGEELIETIVKSIKATISLKPIRLTPEGDFLCDISPGFGMKHTKDEDNLCYLTVGIHKFCNGNMERIQTTKTHDIIVCQKCHLRVQFPRNVLTYGDLRKAFKKT